MDHVDELLGKLGTVQVSLGQLNDVEKAYLDVFTALDYEQGGPEPTSLMLNHKHIAELYRLGLNLQFTVT